MNFENDLYEKKLNVDSEQQSTKNPKDLIIEEETEMMEDMTEGQLADYLAENFNDFGDEGLED